MANRTDPLAAVAHGTNPQFLVEKILRLRIYESRYWREQCFALTAETLVDKAMDLDHVGATFGPTQKPTPFICLVLKMLQLSPEKEIVLEFIKNDDYKYVRALGAFYLRLVGRPADVHRFLEPLLNDFRKLRVRTPQGWDLTHMDEFADILLVESFAYGLSLPHLLKRQALVEMGALEPRRSALLDELEEDELEKAIEDGADAVATVPDTMAEEDAATEKLTDVEKWNEIRAKIGLAPLRE